MKNEKGTVIFLAIVLTTLLLISAAAVFILVTGRFTVTRHIRKKVQAIHDAETASYVAYQMIMDGTWNTGADEDDKTVILKTPDGNDIRKNIIIDVSNDEVSDCQPIRARVRY